MKRFFVFLVLLSCLLSGCNTVTEERIIGDYSEVEDKKEEIKPGDDAVQYFDEAETIKFVLEEYINQLVSKDVDGCVASMPQEFITMIAKQMSCDDSVAREVARDMVEKLFYTKEILYRDIEELWAEQPHKVTIERIDVYPKKDVLFEIYQGYDVVLVDAINIDYKVTLNETEDEAENETENEINKYDRVRFVKMENGEWELDLSFVENHES